MTELALIERIASRSPTRPGTDLGIGDDAAVVATGDRAVVTLDMLVEDVHFRRSTTGLRDLGHKALAVNLSDLAAMAAEPVAALVGLGLPAGMGRDDVDELYEGIEGLAERCGVTVAGGDVTAAPVLVLAVTAVGRPWPGIAPLARSGGRAGDLLCVTGRLGAAAAGLAILESPELAAGVGAAASMRAAHRAPQPRIAAGRALAAGGARAMLDLSDGLALDALRMARACGLRARIELDAVPLAPGVEAVATARGGDPRILAATGGDDYELLAAVPPERLGALRGELDVPLTPVGRLEAGEPELVAVDRDGRAVPLARLGWEHHAEA
jgi:thiamine-monophosphate kinase